MLSEDIEASGTRDQRIRAKRKSARALLLPRHLDIEAAWAVTLTEKESWIDEDFANALRRTRAGYNNYAER